MTATPWQHAGEGEVVILDNRDSFVFNLAHRLWEVGVPSVVVRSDEITLEELRSWRPRALVVSPGPGHPDDAGISVAAIRELAPQIPILGVCLGHQAIAVAFGGVVDRDERPCHGRGTPVEHDGSSLFDDIPTRFVAGRYHSLAVREPVPECLRVTARGDGLVMALEHRDLPVYGVQFHPESVLSPDGRVLLRNWARRLGLPVSEKRAQRAAEGLPGVSE